MLAEIITIGDEILIGQIIDTNSAFIAKELNKIGISVYQITSVQDDREHILKALEEAGNNADIVICTGGLGPTKDDITKHTFCEFFNDFLVEDADVLKHVEYLFAKYITTTKISDVNRKQAMVPSRAKVLKNEYGTAPGMWMSNKDAVYVSLPGVPFEMRGLLKNYVIPLIMEEFHRPHIIHKTLITYGLGESAIAEKIDNWEDALPPFVKLAYLPNLGKVRLRLTAKGSDRELLERTIAEESKKLYPLIGDIIYGVEDEETLEEAIKNLFASKKMTLATAESCTGGKIAQQLTSIPGASAYFKGSVVSYATQTKIEVLGVPEKLIQEHSVVSEEVALAMAKNARELLKTDFAVSTTGNAGPTKGDSDAPIGTVVIGVASPLGDFSERFMMGNHRERIVQKAVHKALELLQKEISKI
ncbi:competence/damage-inducible protein A [Flavobacteriaceae bacterium TP-CH-4]|uniref:CinA-like protein n=1 Tax=Pelagihabitans pacificus TaxID=2696054 RepID=A0A967E5H2_9FLAO|nr:competence/damage-inducible protein A [Pelagihabitans pacificus]NHF58069.1 competence/damage-inducible protein A [Pelagihabitans pacificus]